MSVDPDDLTPGAIKASGAEIVTYGAPVMPGAMFLVAYIGQVPVLGLPGCVMFGKRTIFDVIMPRIAAGLRITRREIRRMGHGGLCLGCGTCIFPACGFGRGWPYGL
jgi:molybdopterin biosynthesis enzyme